MLYAAVWRRRALPEPPREATSFARKLDTDEAAAHGLGGDEGEPEPQNGSRTIPFGLQNVRMSVSSAWVVLCVGCSRFASRENP